MGNYLQKQLINDCQKLNNVKAVKTLLQQGARINIVDQENGACGLHYAAKRSDASMIEFLIEQGIYVNVVDNDNKTPLLWACQKPKIIDNVTVLLKHGADINNTNREYGAWVLHYAATGSDASVLEFLIGKRISINVIDTDKYTPLLWACQGPNNIGNVEVLLKHGADINITNREYGACALHYAAMDSDNSMIEFLIGKGILVNVVRNDNKTPLLWECQKPNNIGNVTVLLK